MSLAMRFKVDGFEYTINVTTESMKCVVRRLTLCAAVWKKQMRSRSLWSGEGQREAAAVIESLETE